MAPVLLLTTLLFCFVVLSNQAGNIKLLDENDEAILDNVILPYDRSSSKQVETSSQDNDDQSKQYNNYYYGYRNDDPQQQQLPIEKPETQTPPPTDDQYLIGVGIADITGPAADINLMGYAKPNQDAGGIHLRQFSRTIIVGDNEGSRVVYISLDNGMVSQLLRMQVLKQLAKKYNNKLYNENNVMMSASHSHSCPGGFFQYVLYNIPSQGFISQTLEALVSGILRSVDIAHNNMKLGRMSYIQGKLTGAGINRSPTAYENNPPLERAQYDCDTDNEMILIKMTDLNGLPIGMINWFPVHGTSMNNTNHLISGDNKGYASILFEQQYNNGALPGKGQFVAIFAQANEGDVSPNTRGPRCIDTGLPCDSAHSTCGSPPRIYKRSRSLHQQARQNIYRQATNMNQRPIARGAPQSVYTPTSENNRGSFNPLYNNGFSINPLHFSQYQQQYGNQQQISDWQSYPDGTSSKEQHWYQRANSWPARILQRAGRSPSLFLSSMLKATSRSSQAHESTNEKCIASGPGKDMFESTKIIAYKQYYKAKELFDDSSSQVRIRGKVRFIHQHIDMSSQILAVDSTGNATQRTCKPALGYSFAAGTTDGPGAFDFQQGDTNSSPFWNMARDFLRKPSEQQVQCHHPKPVLFTTGEMNFPYAWHPVIVPTQIIQLGQLAIVGLPGEFTTMSGRRIRNAVSCAFNNDNSDQCLLNSQLVVDGITGVAGMNDTMPTASRLSPQTAHANDTTKVKVVLSGLSNIYTSYVTTFEEYQVQRYEGASTIYGPYTLQAYLNQFVKLAQLIKLGKPIDNPGPEPENLLTQQIVLKPGVIFDSAPYKKHFGDVLEDVNTSKIYKCQDVVRASFVAGHPRNDLRHEGTFMVVERFNNDTKRFDTIASDSSWETKFIWQRTNSFLGESKAILEWEIPVDCTTGLYRLKHFGASKNLVQQIKQYTGQSSVFQVVADQDQIIGVQQQVSMQTA